MITKGHVKTSLKDYLFSKCLTRSGSATVVVECFLPFSSRVGVGSSIVIDLLWSVSAGSLLASACGFLRYIFRHIRSKTVHPAEKKWCVYQITRSGEACPTSFIARELAQPLL